MDTRDYADLRFLLNFVKKKKKKKKRELYWRSGPRIEERSHQDSIRTSDI
jgi:hypothetical protein